MLNFDQLQTMAAPNQSPGFVAAHQPVAAVLGAGCVFKRRLWRKVEEGGVSLRCSVWKQRSAERREPSADWRQEHPWQPSWQVRVKGGEKIELKPHKRALGWEFKRFHEPPGFVFNWEILQMCNAGLFCVSEADTRQKLLRTVKKEVGVHSWTAHWSRREVYSPHSPWQEPFTYILLIKYQK